MIFPTLEGHLTPVVVYVKGDLFDESVVLGENCPRVVVEAMNSANFTHLHFDDSYITVES